MSHCDNCDTVTFVLILYQKIYPPKKIISKLESNANKYKKKSSGKSNTNSPEKKYNWTEKDSNENSKKQIRGNISNVLSKIVWIDKIFKTKTEINKINYKYINFIKSKQNLDTTLVYKVKITPDGNFFYREVSQFLYNTEENYKLIRLSIFSYVRTNCKEISEFQP